MRKFITPFQKNKNKEDKLKTLMGFMRSYEIDEHDMIIKDFISFIEGEIDTAEKQFLLLKDRFYGKYGRTYIDKLREDFVKKYPNSDKAFLKRKYSEICEYFSVYYDVNDYDETENDENHLYNILVAKEREKK